MPKYRFTEIAINSTEKKKPTEADKATYIGLEHLDSGTLTVSRWGSEVAPIGEKLLMKKGDVLFGKRRAYQKKVGIAPFDGIFSAHGMVLRPREEVITKEYFPLFISSDYFLNEAIRISVGSLSPTVNWKDLKDLTFNIPTIEEQRRITPLVWAAIEAKNAYKTLISRTDDLVKSQFIEMFGVPESNSLGLPAYALETVCRRITDGSHNPPKGIDFSDYYMLSSKNIVDDTITLDDPRFLSKEQWEIENKRTQIAAGDVLLTIVGTVGRSAVVPEKHQNIVLQRSVCVLKPRPEMLNSYFLNFELKCMQTHIDSLAQGAAQRGIYLAQVGKLKVIVPEMSLQEEFVAMLKQSDKSKFELQEAITRIDNFIKSLIQQDDN